MERTIWIWVILKEKGVRRKNTFSIEMNDIHGNINRFWFYMKQFINVARAILFYDLPQSFAYCYTFKIFDFKNSDAFPSTSFTRWNQFPLEW